MGLTQSSKLTDMTSSREADIVHKQVINMSFPANFESEEIINLSRLTEMDSPCDAHIWNKKTLWSKKATTIKIVMWNREFMFDVENSSDNCRVLKNETTVAVFDELLKEIKQRGTCPEKIASNLKEISDMIEFIDAINDKFCSHDNYSNIVGEKTSLIIRDALLLLRRDFVGELVKHTMYNMKNFVDTLIH